MSAGFKCHVSGGSVCARAGLGKGDGLGVGAATGLGPALADHFAVLDDHAADIGIGCTATAGALAERDRLPHPAGVVGHFIPNLRSSSWNWRWRAAARASCSFWRSACDALISASVRLPLQLSA